MKLFSTSVAFAFASDLHYYIFHAFLYLPSAACHDVRMWRQQFEQDRAAIWTLTGEQFWPVNGVTANECLCKLCGFYATALYEIILVHSSNFFRVTLSCLNSSSSSLLPQVLSTSNIQIALLISQPQLFEQLVSHDSIDAVFIYFSSVFVCIYLCFMFFWIFFSREHYGDHSLFEKQQYMILTTFYNWY